MAELVVRFTPRRNALLNNRQRVQESFDAGELPGFNLEMNSIKGTSGKIRGIPADLQQRRVEITGPVERKMVINTLNAHVDVFMADFEDSLRPRGINN